MIGSEAEDILGACLRKQDSEAGKKEQGAEEYTQPTG